MTSDATDARVERWRIGLLSARDAIMAWHDENLSVLSPDELELEMGNRLARAAISLSDQEAAERVEAGTAWTEWERLRDKAFTDAGAIYDTDRPSAALDAFVRSHIALAEAKGAVPEEPVAWRCKTVNGLGWAYLTEHNQGIQMGPEWEPLYATTPRPASSTQAEGGGTGE